jgi:hypothetical protein
MLPRCYTLNKCLNRVIYRNVRLKAEVKTRAPSNYRPSCSFYERTVFRKNPIRFKTRKTQIA